ncbi:MAG: hypothetical protein JWQ73_661, partial [Variovorax sp.]|nr:hypothetical protein [Variovorax sp.]
PSSARRRQMNFNIRRTAAREARGLIDVRRATHGHACRPRPKMRQRQEPRKSSGRRAAMKPCDARPPDLYISPVAAIESVGRPETLTWSITRTSTSKKAPKALASVARQLLLPQRSTTCPVARAIFDRGTWRCRSTQKKGPAPVKTQGRALARTKPNPRHASNGPDANLVFRAARFHMPYDH